jgi:hypothetical protein
MPAVVAQADGGQEVARLLLAGLLHGVLQEVHATPIFSTQQARHLPQRKE